MLRMVTENRLSAHLTFIHGCEFNSVGLSPRPLGPRNVTTYKAHHTQPHEIYAHRCLEPRVQVAADPNVVSSYLTFIRRLRVTLP